MPKTNMQQTTRNLSIIIPCYNEARRLPGTLDALLATVPEAQIICVSNGCRDDTDMVVLGYGVNHPNITLIHSEPGKGNAVAAGMLASTRELRMMFDADAAVSPDQIIRFLDAYELASYAHVFIGSREAPGAKRIGEPWTRHMTGRWFNWIVQALILPGYEDTQCGFKLFHWSVVPALFGGLTTGGWAFDIEVLYRCKLLGIDVYEIPVIWTHDPDSRVRVVRDSLRMFRDILRIKRQALAWQTQNA